MHWMEAFFSAPDDTRLWSLNLAASPFHLHSGLLAFDAMMFLFQELTVSHTDWERVYDDCPL